MMNPLTVRVPITESSPPFRGTLPVSATEFLERLTAYGGCDVREEQLKDWAGLNGVKITRSPKVQTRVGDAVAEWLEVQGVEGDGFRDWWWRGSDETIRVFSDGTLVRLSGLLEVRGIHALSEDLVLVVWGRGLVELWDTSTMRPIRQTLIAEGNVFASQLSARGLLLVCGIDDLVHMLDAATLRSLGQFSVLDDPDVESSMDISSEDDGELEDADLEDDDDDDDDFFQRILGMYPLAAGSMVFLHANDRRYCFDVESGRRLRVTEVPAESESAEIVWSDGGIDVPSDGSMPAGWFEVIDKERIVHRSAECDTAASDHDIRHPEHGVLGAAPLNSGTLLVHTDRNTLRTYSLTDGEWGTEWSVQVDHFTLFAARGQRPATLLVATPDREWLVMDPAKGTEQFELADRGEFSLALAVGETLACVYDVSEDCFVTLDLTTGDELCAWEAYYDSDRPEMAIAGNVLILREDDDSVSWYDVRTGEQLGEAVWDHNGLPDEADDGDDDE